MTTLQKLLTTLFCLFAISNVQAQTVMVAVAANFTEPMQEIAAAFDKETGNNTVLSFASSGKFFAQIKNGAPFDVFLSADTAKPLALEEAELSVQGSRFTYAQGGLILWSPKAGFVDSQSPDVLKTDQFKHLSLANPKLAPYGKAAVETLNNLGVYDDVANKIVMGENIAQAYQFVATHNAQLGFVALSQVMKQGKLSSGSGWIVPKDLYSPIRQDAVLLKKAKDNDAAKALLDFLQSDKALAIIESYGYSH
ncbi:MAG TPA: molybdate ABC transporter substrate-binding protein [Methylophaga aminisulfidivorans]|jgi:molybdate transport system substrate-binding protein|uniref:molybdate ABC transporter substrate-binding protein n=1 Tax=Methylophaga TaxID=40222 RepID=UPI00176D1693|nr:MULTISPECIES: molybdate ABC transporter substrate-binding protein [Methylophaga]HIC47262.1 molybdate ABC transporter substrate-binding protein [Methylophaga sp.]HIM40622.1 molybdate ABC transporter substrate-binding protein [Methylophaga aminisulfidivorans]